MKRSLKYLKSAALNKNYICKSIYYISIMNTVITKFLEEFSSFIYHIALKWQSSKDFKFAFNLREVYSKKSEHI